VLLYQAFAAAPPKFAHVPLILGPDRKRLSKRHGATSVMEYQRLGYLPEAMVNFLSLLGWSPGDDRELFTRDELIAAFTLEGISGGSAIFNPEKLDWFNQQHILRLPIAELGTRVEAVLRDAGLWAPELSGPRREWFHRLLELVRPRVKKLDQFVDELRPFLLEVVEYDQAALTKHLGKPEVQDALAELPHILTSVVPFTSAAIEPALRALAESRGIKAAALIHATRVAVTGRAVSPGLFEVLELMGSECASSRVRDVVTFLTK
jgi:glutamyl/glutaminyl-tRNA synthetase